MYSAADVPFPDTSAISTPTSQSRIERFNRRLPKFLHKYTNALANAPLSHITSFLILHELDGDVAEWPAGKIFGDVGEAGGEEIGVAIF